MKTGNLHGKSSKSLQRSESQKTNNTSRVLKQGKLLHENGFFAHGVMNLTPKECFKLCRQGALIVDVREPYMNSFKMFDTVVVIYSPYSDLKHYFLNLPVDRILIFADAVGLRSREAVIFMKEHGYEYVANMAGGIVDWERDGLPLTTDINSRLSGSCMCQLKPREGRKKVD